MLRRCVLAGLALAALGLPLPAHALIRLDSSFDVDDADYVDFADNFPSVGRFNSGGSALSGVLITPTYVLTAAHVAAELTVGVSSFTVGAQTFTVVEKTLHPDFSLSPVHDDIAVVKLSGSVIGVAPATRYAGAGELGATGYWVGYGQTGTGLTGADGTGRGTERAGTNTLDSYAFYFPGPVPPEDDYLTNSPILGSILIADFDNNTPGNNTLSTGPNGSSQVPTTLETSVAVGDSGGGVFGFTGSEFVLVGINSFNASGPGSGTQYGALAGATRVSYYNSWIQSVIPEPGTWALAGGLTVLTAALLRRRRAR